MLALFGFCDFSGRIIEHVPTGIGPETAVEAKDQVARVIIRTPHRMV